MCQLPRYNEKSRHSEGERDYFRFSTDVRVPDAEKRWSRRRQYLRWCCGDVSRSVAVVVLIHKITRLLQYNDFIDTVVC